MTTPRRRWLAFSLRTLFVVVTVFACWLGYQLNWLRQRHEIVARNLAMIEYSRVKGLVASPSTDRPVTAPGGLWLLGEDGYFRLELIVVVDHYDDRPIYEYPAMKEAMRLFPEADVGGAMVSKAVIRELQAREF